MKQWIIPGVMGVFGLISVATLKSVAPSLAAQQAVFFVLGLGVFYITSKFNYKHWLSLAWFFYGAVCALLIASMIAGIILGETGRWIPIFGLFNLQPSQLAIPAVAILASQLIQKYSMDDWTQLFKLFALVGFPGILILIEPDLGTTIVYLVSVGTVVFMSDISWKKISTMVSGAVLISIFAWFFVLQPYQKQRITSFVNPEHDVSGASYNARQALIAAGSGQLFGRGLGQGVQSHLRFLPERQTDFIFASLAEEFGFIGSLFVLTLYAILTSFIIRTGLTTTYRPASAFCTAVAVMTLIQTTVNIGMNIGIMPITGITLPFLSYGGSSILSLSLMYGIVQSIALASPPKQALHLR
jgi:rod shape determining protein RodA